MKKDKQKWLDALDRRVIVKNGYPPLHEVKVKEVSKQYVKLHFVETGKQEWYDFNVYRICEVLPARYEAASVASSDTSFENEMYKKITRAAIENELRKKPIGYSYSHKGDIVETIPLDKNTFK
jgi:hypothetical protein